MDRWNWYSLTRPKIEATIAKERRQYVQWGRDCFGWAIYVFEKPGR